MADSNTLVSKFEDFFKKLKASNETSTLNDLFNIVGQLPEEKKLVSLNNVLRHKETSFSKIIFKNEDKTKVFDAKKYFNELLAKAFKNNNLNSARLLIAIEFLTGYLKKYYDKFNDFDKEYLKKVFRLNDNIFSNNDLPSEFNNYKKFFQKQRKNLFLEVIKKGNADMISIFVLLESCNDSFDEDGFNFLHLLLRNDDPKPLKCILDLVESAKMDAKNSKKLENGLLIGSKELTKLNEVFESCFKAKRKIKDLNQKTFEISFEKPENFWLLFTTKYKQIEQIFEDYKEKNIAIRKKDMTLFFYCITRDYYDILILLLDKLITGFNSNNSSPVYYYIDNLITKKINFGYFLYYFFYFDKITNETSQDSKVYKFISKLIEFSKLKKEYLFNELFFSYNMEQLTCFDLILKNENRQFLNFVFAKYEPFSGGFLNFSNIQKNNCLHLAAIYECYDSFDFLFGEVFKKCKYQINEVNNENKTPLDMMILNKKFDLFLNFIKKVDNLKINIQSETFICVFKQLDDDEKVKILIQKINLTMLNFNLLMNKLIIDREENSALKLVNFMQDFTIQANELETLDMIRNLLKLKWNNTVEKMFENSATLRNNKFGLFELMVNEDNFSEELAVAYFNLIIGNYSDTEYHLIKKIYDRKWNKLFEISIDTEIENLNKANKFDVFIEKYQTNIIDFLKSIISLFNAKVINKDKFQIKINDDSLCHLIEFNEQDLVRKMLEFNINEFISYENFLLKSIQVNNEQIAQNILNYVSIKSNIEVKMKFNFDVLIELIKKKWWTVLKDLNDLKIEIDSIDSSNSLKNEDFIAFLPNLTNSQIIIFLNEARINFNFNQTLKALIQRRDRNLANKLMNIVSEMQVDIVINNNEYEALLEIIKEILNLKWFDVIDPLFSFLNFEKIRYNTINDLIKDDKNLINEESLVHFIKLLNKSLDEAGKKNFFNDLKALLLDIYEKKLHSLIEFIIDEYIGYLNESKILDDFFKNQDLIQNKDLKGLVSFIIDYCFEKRSKVKKNKVTYQIILNSDSFCELIKFNDENVIKTLLEFDQNNFNDFERYILASIDVNNERIAEFVLDYAKFKSKSKLVEWKCSNKTLIPDLIEKNWVTCVHKLLDLIHLNYASISYQAKTKKSTHKPKQTFLNIQPPKEPSEEENLFCSGNGIVFKLENDTKNHENKQTFFYLDSDDNKKCLTTTHPLICIAKSKNDDLINHETVSNLLKLKWRWLPRLTYYSFTLFYILFLSFFINHTYINSMPIADNNLTNTSIDSRNSSKATALEMKIENIPWFLWILIGIFFLMEILQIWDHMKLNKLGIFKYISDLKNILELLTCVSSILALSLKSTSWTSLTIISGSLVMILRLEKMRLIGKYSVAFRRTILNSAILLPMFIILLVAFLFSFKVRSSFDVNHFNGTFSNSFLKTLSMVVGDYETSEMGVEDGGHYTYFNIFIYSLFIIVMSILFNNLFVAIAVGELANVLKEAKIYHKCLRIQHVIRTEELLYTIMPCKDTLVHYFPINYAVFEPENEYRIVRFYKKILGGIMTAFEVNHVKSKQTGIDDLKEIILNLERRNARMEINLENLSQSLEIKTKNLEKSILNLNEEINSLKKEALAKI